ncbi:hypothetical protein POTOM_009147 [Populus tomentosa]|uniref:Peptidase C83 domain-containing protein n=1 Tax=Populus tomentosa TaxID=118781 RepID=A0A8X8D4W0_POPTO|nr:hypothetical protein POTOM_009147 [Populus tomentosa]
MLDIEALEGGTLNSFFKLIPSDQTQSDPACCGLASLAMVLNALAEDPGRTRKDQRKKASDMVKLLAWLFAMELKLNLLGQTKSQMMFQTGSGHFLL